MVKFIFKFYRRNFFVHTVIKCGIISAVYKDKQFVYKGIKELIFIRQNTVFSKDVKHFDRSYGVAFHLRNQIGVTA